MIFQRGFVDKMLMKILIICRLLDTSSTLSIMSFLTTIFNCLYGNTVPLISMGMCYFVALLLSKSVILVGVESLGTKALLSKFTMCMLHSWELQVL